MFLPAISSGVFKPEYGVHDEWHRRYLWLVNQSLQLSGMYVCWFDVQIVNKFCVVFLHIC
ncbi:hypothetical protein BGI40_08420 [Snodgrassella communis]|jgi:hypothetical protein|uniref:Uncharacterized protein n=2 Tax=Snodgrassella TaxID=1193515 RepID=A0A2N9XH50_9NEIS|nr:hypothetical protein SALWKB12_0827 [Snodgrassella communis]PIT47655.1 hypothetical protein BHC46_04955 [Snodgrassella alvi]KDN14068.1 hypothetical protein SALWKB29_1858 [Snodgrassella communis]PIT07893.1 hypothetical protein BGI31_07825 [Snodgrassella communis]PIT11517.1 hypothetical protein BGI29_00660 [Snodgrassella communis]